MPGVNWGTKNDKIVVVGAHWDSVESSPGKIISLLRNNGKNKICRNIEMFM